jgi:putative ABC transport system permease protein
MTELRQDAGYAMRLLKRAPGFSALAIGTLAIGIAATTAIFTIVDSVILRPLRFPEPHRLVMLLPTSGSRLSPGYFHDWLRQAERLPTGVLVAGTLVAQRRGVAVKCPLQRSRS